MRIYADTSFLLKLLAQEPDSDLVAAAYRRLGLPPLFFLPLHALEVRNAILQRAFFQRRSVSTQERQHIIRERDTAFARLEHFITRRTFLDVTLDMDAALAQAISLSRAHTERMGARAIDVLHVANALTLESELFLTTDARQANLAKAEGLKVLSIASRIS
jgi:predicted nucleic acid-binding protein